MARVSNPCRHGLETRATESQSYEQLQPALSAAKWVASAVRLCDAHDLVATFSVGNGPLLLILYEGQEDLVALDATAIARLRAHADPAARAWLPGVRMTFADG